MVLVAGRRRWEGKWLGIEERGEHSGIVGGEKGVRRDGGDVGTCEGGREVSRAEYGDMGSVIAEEGAQDGEEELLGLLTRAGEQKTGALVGVAGERVADSTAQELLKGRVVVGEAVKEGVPDG